MCEWKGAARYFNVTVGGVRAVRAAWFYPDPTPAFAALKEPAQTSSDLAIDAIENFKEQIRRADVILATKFFERL